MHRIILAVSVVLIASAAIASDALVQLSGWAEIPSTYRHPGPVSGQFTGPANGVTPPYAGQPIPGFSGMIPSPPPGSFFALPDNGFGAQANSADFVIGFYEVTPSFKTVGDGTTSRGPVAVNGFTPFSDPQRLLESRRTSRMDRSTTAPTTIRRPLRDSGRSVDQGRPAADRRRLRRRVHRPHGRRHVLGWRGVRTVSAALRRAGPPAEPAGPSSRAAGAAEPAEHRSKIPPTCRARADSSR